MVLHREELTIDYISIKEEDVISAVDKMSLNLVTVADSFSSIHLKTF